MIALWGKIKLWAIGLAVAGAAIATAYWRVREDGKNVIRAEQDRARLDAIKSRKETDDETAGMDSTTLDRNFDRWLRDDKR